MSNNRGPYYERGVYRCEIIDQGLTTASTGTPQIFFKIRVLEGVHPEGPVNGQYERYCFLPITEKTVEYLVPKLEALGYTGDGLDFLDLNNPRAHDMRGQESNFFCKHESKDGGVLQEKWDVATGGGGGAKDIEVRAVNQAEIRKLNALFGRAKKQAGGPTSAPAQRSAPRPVAANSSAKQTSSRSAVATEEPPDFPDTGVSDDDIQF